MRDPCSARGARPSRQHSQPHAPPPYSSAGSQPCWAESRPASAHVERGHVAADLATRQAIRRGLRCSCLGRRLTRSPTHVIQPHVEDLLSPDWPLSRCSAQLAGRPLRMTVSMASRRLGIERAQAQLSSVHRSVRLCEPAEALATRSWVRPGRLTALEPRRIARATHTQRPDGQEQSCAEAIKAKVTGVLWRW